MLKSICLCSFFAVFVTCASPAAFAALASHNTETTDMTPHMEAPIEPGRNVVFCSTFQIAWNQMKNDIVKDDIRLAKPQELIRILNLGRTMRTDISDADYLAMVGFGSDNIANKVNRALRERFGDDAPTLDDVYNQDDVILAFAFLLKELKFEELFEDFTDPMTFQGGRGQTGVESFGIYKYSEHRHLRLGDQVEVFDYKRHGDFIVRLKTKDPEDEMILASVTPEKTLLETYERVNSRVIHSKPGRLNKNDVLMIPKIDFLLDHQYSSLIGAHLLNEGFEGYFVQEARQAIRFTLNESGASAKSVGIFALKKGPPVDFKMLVFHDPFMIYLKKKDAKYPYLAMWFGNPDLMVKSN